MAKIFGAFWCFFTHSWYAWEPTGRYYKKYRCSRCERLWFP